ncbi:hypothetical protein E2986_13477 [Frieseomelitta varia]|uniref:Uncharacterized protein n=1 Tax=Frieseomelitta varia TaxID=561572 RepID=A0A833VLY7_9HYME|nr:hypothetical protein E2986_13477 [Frieseomelitta varia]
MINANVILDKMKRKKLLCIPCKQNKYHCKQNKGLVQCNKLLLQKLWCVLQNGRQCCANIIYPYSLPLVNFKNYVLILVTCIQISLQT